jgi:type IV pilus assembly protein PilM
MTKSLPESPSLSSLKYEAKQLLKTHRIGDDSVCEMLRQHSKFSDKTNKQILATKVSLQDAQHALALEYGFENWSALTEAIQEKLSDAKLAVADIRVNLFDQNETAREAPSNEPRLGIDIGSSCIKLLELSRDGSKLTVERFGTEPLPPGAVVEGNVKDVETVAAALSRLVQRCKPTTVDAVVGVSGAAVIIKTIEMPAGLSDDELENEILQQVDQYVPYPLDEITLSFEVKGQSTRDDGKIEVLLAMCKNESTVPKNKVLEKAGLHTQVVDLEAHAVNRAYLRLREHLGIDKEATVAMFEFGSTVTGLHVTTGFGSPYIRYQLFGGRRLTEEIQRQYGVPAAEAEAAARSRGEGLPENYAVEVRKPWLEAVVSQAAKSLEFFYSTSPIDAVDHILLCGGVGATLDLAEEIKTNLKVPVTVVNPFDGMSLSPEVDGDQLDADASSLVLTCGLALRGVTTQKADAIATGRNRTIRVPDDFKGSEMSNPNPAIVRFINQVLADSIRDNVDEIHFICRNENFTIQFAAEDELREVYRPPVNLYEGVNLELCSMFGVTSPAEANMSLANEKIAASFKMLPSSSDDKIVLRILDPEGGAM